MSSKTLKYVPTQHDRKFNPFIEEYFSGPDTTIVCDNKKLNNISHIEFSLQEQLKPIYSYNSYVWDDVAVGNRIIVGSITVPLQNVKENNNFNGKIINAIDDSTVNQKDEEENKPGWTSNTEQSAYNTENNINNKTTTDNTKKETVKTTTRKHYEQDLDKIQEILKEIGYDVDITGIYDKKTQKAIQKYRERNNVEENSEDYSEVIRNLILKNYNAKCVSIEAPIYIAPNINTNVIAKVKKEDKLIIKAVNNDFYYVKIKGKKQSGYILKKSVERGNIYE